MQKLISDLRLAIRQLAKSPGFAITAVLMLAFGIALTTAVFSIVEAVLLRPLPYPDSVRIIVLSNRLAGANIGGSDEVGVAVPEIETYTRETHSFTALGGYQGAAYEMSVSGEPVQVTAARMTPGVFSVLGVAPQLGRIFTADEMEHGEQAAVLSYATWVSRFHGDAQILGTKILLDRKPFVVIGVMPRNFEFPLTPGHLNRTELWVPMSLTEQERAPAAAADFAYQMVGRLKPGVSAGEAQADAETVAQEIMRGFPAMMADARISAKVTLLEEKVTGQTRPLLLTLFLAVAVVLLVACANLAGLMLVRAIRREREVALRLALGARASALLRQAILEGLVLSMGGGGLGLALAAAALLAGRNELPESLPRIGEIGLNWPVAGFALLLSVATGVACGLAPALMAMRTNVSANLNEGGRSGSAGGGHARLQSTLVVAEIAIALTLLTASCLLLRSFGKMRSVDLGFEPQHVTTASYSLPVRQYQKQEQVDAFNRELLRRLNALPGVIAAGMSNKLPAAGGIDIETFVVEGYTPPKGADMNLAAASQLIGNFFPAMGIPLLRGRWFTEADRHGAPLTIIVNRKLAEHYWPGQDPLGKRMRLATPESDTPWLTVVGEVSDVKLSSPDAPTQEQYFLAVDQGEDEAGALALPTDLNGNTGYIVLRSSQPPEQMENGLRSAVRSIDPLLPLTQVQTMEQAVSETEAPRRFNTVLIGGFAFAAVLLALMGIYSVISFSIVTRVREMAIRMALGSQRAAIVRLVLISAAKLAAAGCVIGLAGAAAASKLLRSLLFGVSPFDPVALSLAAATVLLLAIAASGLPALRAASVDPIRALRAE
jgi:predicted permease